MEDPTRQIHLRLPESLRRRLEEVAKANRRSMNTEIVFRLEQSLKAECERKTK